MTSQFTTNIGEAYHALHHNAQELARDGYAVIDGCTPTESATDMAVDIGSGRVHVGGPTEQPSSDTVPLNAADPNYPRKDVIVWNPSADAFEAIAGQPEQPPADQQTASKFQLYQPSPPSLNDSLVVPIAEVFVGAGETDVQTDDIRDRRTSPATAVVLKSATTTLSGGATPAAEATVQDVGADQTDGLAVGVRPDSDPGFDADYGYNFDVSKRWDDDQSAWDVSIVVSWDTDPGAGNDVTASIDIYKR
jgi:hypothetical protein